MQDLNLRLLSMNQSRSRSSNSRYFSYLYLYYNKNFLNCQENFFVIIEYNGIEPLLLAYQASFLPLKEYSEPVTGIEPVSTAWRAAMLSRYTTRTKIKILNL